MSQPLTAQPALPIKTRTDAVLVGCTISHLVGQLGGVRTRDELLDIVAKIETAADRLSLLVEWRGE